MSNIGTQGTSLQESLSEYARELLQEGTGNVQISVGSKVSPRIEVVLEKLAKQSGKERSVIAGEILAQGVEIVYKALEDKLQVTEEEVQKRAKEIESSNKRKGKRTKAER